MTATTKILNVIFVILFVEAILFAPVVLMIATAGNEASRTMKYAVPFFVALMPYLILRRTKHKIGDDGYSKLLLALGLIIGICFLVFFTGIMVTSCSGHPPY